MMENSENSLSFFTTNHSNHSSQWRMNGANISVVCVACLVELLENTDVVNLRKRKVLGELIVLLVNNQNLLELLTQNAKITSHLGKILMDLLSTENELLMNTTIEALDILIVKVRSEILVEEMVGNLEGKILQLNNFKKSYPFVLTLGRFLKSIPALSLRVAKDSQSLVQYLLENILYPEEDIKTAFLFVLVEICSNEGAFNALKSQVQEEICRKTCAVVACGLAVNVQRNSLGIIRLLSQKSDVLGTALKTSNKGTPAILESLKKLMLSSTEAIQIGAIQCVTRILRNDPEDNTYTKAILTSGIGELLLGDLESSNDLVLGSVFCSLDHVVRTHAFYSDGFSVYGIDSIIIGISKAIRLKNSDIVRQGLRVLSLVLSTHPRCVQLFPNEEISKKCASVLLETFKATDHRVLIEAACAVEHFLGIHLHPLSMEFEVIVPLVTAIISQLQKFTNPRMHFRNIPTGSVEAFLYAILKTIKKTFNFIEEFRAKEPSYDALLTRNHRSIATANDSLDHLLQSLWKSIDQLCVPAVIYNCKSVENPAVFAIFFQILHISLSPKNSYGERFAHKLASGSFVRLSLEIKEKFHRMAENTELTEAITLFLAELCVACSNAADRIQLKDRLKTESINSIYSKSVAINLLAQNSVRQDTGEINDESLFNTQCCCIELLYLSFTHGDEIVHLEELVMCLHRFLIQHPDLSVFYRVSLKHLLFLCLIAFNKLRSTPLSSSISQSVKDTQKILEDSFMRFSPDEFDDVYFQDVMFVSWIISSESLSEKFGRQVLICFIQKAEEERDLCMFDAFREVLKSSLPGLIPLISLVDFREENVVSIVVKVLEALITEVSALESDSDGSSNADMPKPISLANLVTNIFQKLFLGNKVKPLPDHSIAAMLKIMTALQINFPAAFEIKLLYQVVNVLTSANICQRFTIPAINYLNVALAWGFHEENLQVPSVLLANEALYEFIQRILDTMQVKDVENPTCPCHLKAGILVLISSLALSLSNVSHNCREPFKVGKQCMVTFTNERESILGITSLIFWDVYFRTTERTSCQPILELHGMVHGNNRCLKLSDVDQDVLHVYLQNSLVHDSEIVRLCAVKCLGSFLCYVPDASSYASSPWNNVVLECSLSLLSAKVMTSGLVLFCSLMLKHAPEKHASTQILSNTVQSVLIKIPDIRCSEKALSWNCVYLLAKVLSLEHYSMLQVQWGLISIWLQAFKDSVSASRAQNDGSKEGFTFYTLDGLIIAKDLLKTKNDEDPRLLDKAILLVRNKVDKEIEQATSQCTSE